MALCEVFVMQSRCRLRSVSHLPCVRGRLQPHHGDRLRRARRIFQSSAAGAPRAEDCGDDHPARSDISTRPTSTRFATPTASHLSVDATRLGSAGSEPKSHCASSSSRYAPRAISGQPRVDDMKSRQYQGIYGMPRADRGVLTRALLRAGQPPIAANILPAGVASAPA